MHSREQRFAYPLRPVTQGPYRLINVDFVAKRVWERRPSGYSRCDGRLEEVHRRGAADDKVRFVFARQPVAGYGEKGRLAMLAVKLGASRSSSSRTFGFEVQILPSVIMHRQGVKL